MAKIKIPSSIKDAATRLAGLERLLVATEWEKSAIVRAHCEKKQGSRSDTTSIKRDVSKYSIKSFSELGIVGLTQQNTVRRYYDSWDLSGKPEPEPGKEVELPTKEFPTAQELADEREKKQLLDDLVKKERENASTIHEYDEAYWGLLDDDNRQELLNTMDEFAEVLAAVDQDKLKEHARYVEELLSGDGHE